MFAYLYKEYKASFSGLPAAAWVLALMAFVNRSGSMVLFFLTLYLTTQKGFSAGEAGRMISLYGLGAMGGAFLGGRLSDRIGAVRVQTISLLLSAVGFVILGYLNSPLLLSVFIFLFAVMSETLRPANATAMAEACPPDKRARGMALNRLAVNFGMAIGPALGGFLAAMNYLYLFWADGITCFLAALILLFYFRGKSHHFETPVSKKERVLQSPYKDRPFLVALVLLLALGLLFTQTFSTWPLYLKNVYLLGENRIGLLMAFNALLVTLIEMPLVYRMERKNTILIMSAGSLFLFAGFGILPLGETFVFSLFTVLIWTIGEILIFPLFSGWVANRAGSQNRGQYMGLFMFTFALSFVLGPSLGTQIYERFGPDILWFGFGLAGIVVAFGFRLLNRMLNNRVG